MFFTFYIFISFRHFFSVHRRVMLSRLLFFFFLLSLASFTLAHSVSLTNSFSITETSHSLSLSLTVTPSLPSSSANKNLYRSFFSLYWHLVVSCFLVCFIDFIQYFFRFAFLSLTKEIRFFFPRPSRFSLIFLFCVFLHVSHFWRSISCKKSNSFAGPPIGISAALTLSSVMMFVTSSYREHVCCGYNDRY